MALRIRSILPTIGVLAAAGLIAVALVGQPGVGAASVPDDDRALLESIAQRVEDVYYKPVNTRDLITGELQGLRDLLRERHLTASSLPTMAGNGDEDHDNAIIDHILDVAIDTYGRKVSARDLTQNAIKGMLAVLHDPYTVYLTPDEFSTLEESLKGGDFSGIGVYIIEDPRTQDVLLDPIEGTPAARAGLKAGDTIVAVDGHKIHGMKEDIIEHMIRGREGSIVTLLVRPRNATTLRVVHIARETIHVPSVHAKIEDRIEYVRLSDFGDTSATEVRNALLNGKNHHVRGYILDLRDNGGGLVDAAVEISSLFIPQGPIVSTIDRGGAKDTKSALGDAMNLKPLVVLVNQYTASASEITAGAIQDDKVGTLIGTRTFGKGIVQSIYHLDSGALKVTTERYVTPAGRDIHHKGIKPDLWVRESDDPRVLDTDKDTQLNAAKSFVARWSGRS